MQQNSSRENSFDVAWQNADGSLKRLCRAQLRALSAQQRAARERAQNREYSTRCQLRYLGLSERERDAAMIERRARRLARREKREKRARLQADAARREEEKRERARNHPAFPPPPGASVDEEIRLRILRANACGRRPACGFF